MADETVSPMANKIDQIIKEFGQDISFSAEAMQQFLQLKTACDQYESNQRDFLKDQEESKALVAQLNSRINDLQGVLGERDHEIEGWRTRENEFKDREDNCLRHELVAQYSEKRVEDHQMMVGLIFRNTELRKRVLGNELVTLPGTPDDRDEWGNTRGGTGRPPEAIGVPIEKVETETKE